MNKQVRFSCAFINSQYCFSNNKAIIFASGFYETSDETEIAELRAAIASGATITEVVPTAPAPAAPASANAAGDIAAKVATGAK